MTRMKRMAALVSVVCLVSGMMTACGSSGSSSEKSTSTAATSGNAATEENAATDGNAATEADTSSEPEETTEAEKAPAELSDELFDCQISLGGNVITLPCSLKTLNNDGWTSSEKGGSYNNLALDGSCISVGTDQKDTDKVKCLQCYYGFNDAEAKLAKDIVIGKSTREEVKAAYGEPTETVGSDSGDPNFKYCLKDADGKTIKYVVFRFDGGNKEGYIKGSLWGVEIRCDE